MSASRHRVTVFMIIGVVAAIVTGIVVWKMSLPTPADEAGYEASSTSATTDAGTRSTTSSTRAPQTSSPAPEANPAQGGQDVDSVSLPAEAGGAASARDPLLPPNAVVNSAPRSVAPTQVYRPSNILPTSVAREDAGEASAASNPADPTAAEPTQAPTPAEGTDTTGTTAPAQPTSPAESPAPGLPSAPLDNGEKPEVIAPEAPAPTPAPDPAVTQQYTPGSEDQNWWGRVRGYLRF
ncbi:hypothetical protein [Corynebacterium senegalense]|uniref:hypothetical protein n=1 Tax=Corynebacterium senegalense TaxID=2080750 RepID=UPI0011C0244A|nr:hypothetical protein [Corynebacterium senegalense]